MRKLGWSAVVCMLWGCSVDRADIASDQSKIINGAPAPGVEYQAVGSLRMPFFGPFCTATLIHPKIALTAEHCVEGIYNAQLAFGSDSNQPETLYAIKEAVVEKEVPGGGLELGSDIAVLHLDKEVTEIEPIPLGLLGDVDVGGTFTGVGYGIQTTDGNLDGTRHAGSFILQGLQGKVLQNRFSTHEAFLEALKKDYKNLTDEEIKEFEDAWQTLELLPEYEAQFGNGSDAQGCNGDSGGPIFRATESGFELVAVFSWVFQSDTSVCNWMTIGARLGPKAMEFVNAQIASVD